MTLKVQKIYLLVLFFTLLFLGACQTRPQKIHQLSKGEWKARALVKDLKTRKSQIVNLSIASKEGVGTRVDVFATLGFQVASILMTPKEVRYLLPREKKHYVTEANAAAFQKVLTVSLSPEVLESILFDRPMNSQNWACTKDKAGFVAECKSLKNRSQVLWKERRGEKKTVFFETGRKRLQINFRSFSKEISDEKKRFKMKVPPKFETIRVSV